MSDLKLIFSNFSDNLRWRYNLNRSCSTGRDTKFFGSNFCYLNIFRGQINGAQGLGLWAALLGAKSSSMWRDSRTSTSTFQPLQMTSRDDIDTR
jgi:hypothetical protein